MGQGSGRAHQCLEKIGRVDFCAFTSSLKTFLPLFSVTGNSLHLLNISSPSTDLETRKLKADLSAAFGCADENSD